MRVPLFLLLISSVPCASAAVSPSDFYCAELPLSIPSYYGMVTKECGGKAETTEGVCIQNVTCTHVSDETKAAVVKSLKKKSFADVAPEEVKQYFKANIKSFEWMAATLTCKGSKDPTTKIPFCPMPEECKGDTFFKMEGGVMDQDKFKAAQTRFNQQDPKIFNAGKPASQAKEANP